MIRERKIIFGQILGFYSTHWLKNRVFSVCFDSREKNLFSIFKNISRKLWFPSKDRAIETSFCQK
jgi:hypothetical protein